MSCNAYNPFFLNVSTRFRKLGAYSLNLSSSGHQRFMFHCLLGTSVVRNEETRRRHYSTETNNNQFSAKKVKYVDMYVLHKITNFFLKITPMFWWNVNEFLSDYHLWFHSIMHFSVLLLIWCKTYYHRPTLYFLKQHSRIFSFSYYLDQQFSTYLTNAYIFQVSNSFFQINFWCSSFLNFIASLNGREAVEAYSAEVYRIAGKLLESISLLMGMDKDSLVEMHMEVMQALRVNYCPTCCRPDQVLGVSPHSDTSTITNTSARWRSYRPPNSTWWFVGAC